MFCSFAAFLPWLSDPRYFKNEGSRDDSMAYQISLLVSGLPGEMPGSVPVEKP